MQTMSKEARKEFVKAISARYRQGSKLEKGRILGDLVAVSGCHRKHAIRLLKPPGELSAKPAIVVGRKIYDEAVKEVLIVVWEAADRICGKRLKAVVAPLLEAMEKHGHVKLEAEVRKKVVSVSAVTIDRILKPVREGGVTRKRRRAAKKAAKAIAIKTYHDWYDPQPGYLEIDFVVHGGDSMAGEYIHSLVATDVCCGWTESVALLAREQSLVVEGLKLIRKQMPVPVLGINSDNDSAFINDTLASYCEREGIVFTRARAYHKNDQAWIEQKNGSVIRRIVGYERFSGIVAGQTLAQLYQFVRLYVNFFQPSFKLRERTRLAGKVKKSYHQPATPCDQLLAQSAVAEAVKDALRTQRSDLDPVELLHRVRQGQSALAALSSGNPTAGPNKQSLDEFLAQLPRLWRLGEVRPTHRKEEPKAHDWRTREDPFQDVWTEILLWLQSDPDCIAKSLFGRLNKKYPKKFRPGQLRTLQRRLSDWRQTMARELIFCGARDQEEIQPVIDGRQPSHNR